MPADQHLNFAYSSVATAPSPATTGTTLVVQSGDGALFPTPPFNVTISPNNVRPSKTNAEIARVLSISGDTLTILRAQEGSTARSIVPTDQVAATITQYSLELAEGPNSARHFSVCGLGASGTSNDMLNPTTNYSGGAFSLFDNAPGHPGINVLHTGTTTGAYATYIGFGDGTFTGIDSGDNWDSETIFKTDATLNVTDLRVGLTRFTDNSTQPQGIWIEKLAADTNWFVKVGNANVFDARQNTGVSVTASTWYTVKLGRLGTQIYWSINRAAPSYYTPTNMPSSGLMQFIVALFGTTNVTDITLSIDYVGVSVSGLSR